MIMASMNTMVLALLLLMHWCSARFEYAVRRRGGNQKTGSNKLSRNKFRRARALNSISSTKYEDCGKAGGKGKGGKGDDRRGLSGCSCPEGEEDCSEYGDPYDDPLYFPTAAPIYDDNDQGLTGDDSDPPVDPSPTLAPIPAPTLTPVVAPTSPPTTKPTTLAPSFAPTVTPVVAPTSPPTTKPTTLAPILAPTVTPTSPPTTKPTTLAPAPTLTPVVAPTSPPTPLPTMLAPISPPPTPDVDDTHDESGSNQSLDVNSDYDEYVPSNDSVDAADSQASDSGGGTISTGSALISLPPPSDNANTPQPVPSNDEN